MAQQVNYVEMQDIKGHGHSPEDQKRVGQLLDERLLARAIQPREQQDGRADGHQQELQRRSIFLDVKEIDHRHRCRGKPVH